MKIIHSQDLDFVAASHENPKNPGVWKKILCSKEDFIRGQIQMLNWAKMPAGSSFARHYHEDMQEVFVIVEGQVEIRIDDESGRLGRGDAVIIPPAAKHEMFNLSSGEAEYIAIGVSREQAGKTVVVK